LLSNPETFTEMPGLFFFINFTPVCENSEMTNHVGLERAVVICWYPFCCGWE